MDQANMSAEYKEYYRKYYAYYGYEYDEAQGKYVYKGNGTPAAGASSAAAAGAI